MSNYINKDITKSGSLCSIRFVIIIIINQQDRDNVVAVVVYPLCGAGSGMAGKKSNVENGMKHKYLQLFNTYFAWL